jgi:hypothetical protein
MEGLTKDEKDYITKTFRTLISNLVNCIKLLNYYEQPDSKKEIVKDTLQIDLDYLTKLDDFIKGKFNMIGE